MKIFIKILFIIFISFFIIIQNISAFSFWDLFQEDSAEVKIDCWEQGCNLSSWVDIVKWTVTGIETERPLSEYIQDITVYILSFLTIVSVIYIIYAWFRILISVWDDEVIKKQKSTILYVVVWLAVIWLAYPILVFVLGVLSSGSESI